jgi:hypothetical protein
MTRQLLTNVLFEYVGEYSLLSISAFQTWGEGWLEEWGQLMVK